MFLVWEEELINTRVIVWVMTTRNESDYYVQKKIEQSVLPPVDAPLHSSNQFDRYIF